jgi:predicted outer membrane repeat protein
LEGVTIRNGYANEGGGVYCWAASPTISNVILSGNVAVYSGGGLYCGRGSAPVLTNVTLDDNSAAQGGGIYCTYYSAPVIQQSILSYSRHGGAVVLGGPGNSPVFTCCDIYGNTGGDWNGEISIQFSQSGNICEDPLFCMEANPDEPYGLHSSSPCISTTESGCGIMGAVGIGCASGHEATVDIDPNVLNPKSRRRWLTCYLELPEGHDPHEIDVSTVVLNGEVSAEMRPTAVGDHDADGIRDRMVKFSWPDVLASLESYGDVEFEVSGQAGTEAFSGTDTVRVLTKKWDSKHFTYGTDSDVTGELRVINPGEDGHGSAIRLDVLVPAHVKLTIHDVRGRVIRTLLDEVKHPDSYVIYWDAKDTSDAGVAPGVYFVHFETQKYRAINKIVVVR